MSMTSCEISSSSRSASAGSDFQCTGDELYESFMEIANNQELHIISQVLESTGLSEKKNTLLSNEPEQKTDEFFEYTEKTAVENPSLIDVVNINDVTTTDGLAENINNSDINKPLSDVPDTVEGSIEDSVLLDVTGRKMSHEIEPQVSTLADNNNREENNVDEITETVNNYTENKVTSVTEDVRESKELNNGEHEVMPGSSHENDVVHDIADGIRKANQVCDEINEFIHSNRMSQCSDTMQDQKESVRENDMSTNTDQNDTSCNKDKTNNKDKSPISINIIAPTSKQGSFSGESHSSSSDDLELRKKSVSDSLCSSDGSSYDGSMTPDVSPACGDRPPINWDVLNLALGSGETDEEDAGVYEHHTTSYGGFGIVMEEDNDKAMHSPTTEDKARLRSISQSSTASELEFKENFQLKTSSLDRNKVGVLISGYLLKLGGTGMTPKNWRKRWCVLRHDRCLYYYKTMKDHVPCGIVVLTNYIVSRGSELSKKNCLKLSKGGGRTYFFCAQSQQDMLRWIDALQSAADMTSEGTNFEIREEIIHNVAIPALSIKKPDCHGYLTKQGAKHRNSWKRRYCVLKDGCLYYYREMSDTTALGVAKLHGYTVEDAPYSGKRHAFRALPPHPGMRTFAFFADNDYDKKRWMPCIEQSIKKQYIST